MSYIKDLHKPCSNYSYKIVMGDFNADFLSKSSEVESLRDLVNELSSRFVNQGLTNHVGNSHTWIDVICVDDNDEMLDRGQEVAHFNNTHDDQTIYNCSTYSIIFLQKIQRYHFAQQHSILKLVSTIWCELSELQRTNNHWRTSTSEDGHTGKRE